MDSVTTLPGYNPPVIKLSDQQQEVCKHNLRFLQDLGPEIEKVAACGVDCSSYHALKARLREVNEAIAQHFVKPPIPV